MISFSHPLLLLPSIFPSIRVFSNESAIRIMWPKYWNFSFSISPLNEYSGLISFSIDWFDLLAVQKCSRVFSNTTVQKHQFLGSQPSLYASLVARRLKHLPAMRETWVRSLGQKDPLEKEMVVFLPGEFHGQRSLAGYSPWGRKESDKTERLTLSLSL